MMIRFYFSSDPPVILSKLSLTSYEYVKHYNLKIRI